MFVVVSDREQLIIAERHYLPNLHQLLELFSNFKNDLMNSSIQPKVTETCLLQI